MAEWWGRAVLAQAEVGLGHVFAHLVRRVDLWALLGMMDGPETFF